MTRRHPTRSGLARLLAVVLACVLAVGCGVPRDDEPRAIADETTVPPSTADDATDGSGASVVLVDAATDALVTRERAIDGDPNPMTVLTALLQQPTAAELDEGLKTLIPPTAAVLSITEVDGVWAVDMNADWTVQQGTNALLAYAQVVLTLTMLPEVEQVRFSSEGTPIADAPTDEGDREVLSAADYETLAP